MSSRFTILFVEPTPTRVICFAWQIDKYLTSWDFLKSFRASEIMINVEKTNKSIIKIDSVISLYFGHFLDKKYLNSGGSDDLQNLIDRFS